MSIGTKEDVDELQAIRKDLAQCGGPRQWHLDDMLKMMIHMRRLIGEALDEFDRERKKP